MADSRPGPVFYSAQGPGLTPYHPDPAVMTATVLDAARVSATEGRVVTVAG